MTEVPRSAIVYARISQDRVGAGLGVERQGADCRALAERLGWQVTNTYSDNDVSAYSGKPRPGYRALLADLQAGKATGVLTWHTDRLHRSPVELERYIEISEQHGVVTHTVQAGPLDLSTPSGRMVARQLGAVARFESEHKSARIKAARQQAAQQGRWSGGVRPFGFEPDGVTIRETEARVIRRASEAILAGASLRSVVRDANNAGFLTTFRRFEWSVIAFRDVLLRPRNAGLRVHQGEVIGAAVWSAIIPEDQWRALVTILEDPGRKTTTGNRVKWLGSGLYVCGGCGQPSLRVSTAGMHRSPAYRCRESGSGHVVRLAHPLDEYIEALIVGRLGMPDAVDLLHPTSPAVDVNALRADAAAARTRLGEIAVMLGDGDLSVHEARVARSRAQDRLERAERALTEATIPSPLEGLAGVPDVATLWGELDLGRRRAVLKKLMTVTVLPAQKTGHFDPDSVQITWKGAD